jgi:hypothetical protein
MYFVFIKVLGKLKTCSVTVCLLWCSLYYGLINTCRYKNAKTQ